nr:hypothetical protein [Tanacetum cinerariifolium]
KLHGPWGVDDCVVMLELKSPGIPLRFRKIYLSLVTLDSQLKVFNTFPGYQVSGSQVDSCIQNLFVFGREMIQLTVEIQQI